MTIVNNPSKGDRFNLSRFVERAWGVGAELSESHQAISLTFG
jgi:hypothetical protein